jgi:hypothetical protein
MCKTYVSIRLYPDISEVPEVGKGYKEADRYRVYKHWFTGI